MLAILFLGAASGFPNQITESALQAWLKDAGATNVTIGVMSYVALPYLLKFLWAPFIDRYPLPLLGRRRGWIVAMQAALGVTIALFALQNPALALAPITASGGEHRSRAVAQEFQRRHPCPCRPGKLKTSGSGEVALARLSPTACRSPRCRCYDCHSGNTSRSRQSRTEDFGAV